MFEYLVIFKGENKKFATLEFKNLWKTYFQEDINLDCLQNTLFFFSSNFFLDKKKSFLNRLTFTNSIFLILEKDLFIDKLLEKTSKLDFTFLENTDFAVDSKFFSKTKLNNAVLAKPIWDNLETPKVNLDKPHEKIFFFGTVFNLDSEIFYICREIFFNSKDYLRRMPKLRPVKRPYTLKSDMARASINLLGLKEGEVFLDPFCGIGGILLEAYDMGLKVIGNDISVEDLNLCKENFNFYYEKNSVSLTNFDCSFLFGEENSVDGIVTDIPYGRACRKIGVDLYEDFLKNSVKILKKDKKLIIIYANFNSIKDLALKYFEVEDEIEEYINKSMTRYILILKNSSNFKK